MKIPPFDDDKRVGCRTGHRRRHVNTKTSRAYFPGFQHADLSFRTNQCFVQMIAQEYFSRRFLTCVHLSNYFKYYIFTWFEKGQNGCGSVGTAVAVDTRGPRFDSSHQQNFIKHLFNINCIEKTKINKKRPGMAHFFKKRDKMVIRKRHMVARNEQCW